MWQEAIQTEFAGQRALGALVGYPQAVDHMENPDMFHCIAEKEEQDYVHSLHSLDHMDGATKGHLLKKELLWAGLSLPVVHSYYSTIMGI
jgi:hypothetical protein